MAESRQLSVRLSEATFAKLEAIKPEGITLAEVARKVIEKQLGTGAELPLLAPRERGPQPVDMTPMLEALEGFEQRVWEAQREVLRAVHEHGLWVRLRSERSDAWHGAEPEGAERRRAGGARVGKERRAMIVISFAIMLVITVFGIANGALRRSLRIVADLAGICIFVVVLLFPRRPDLDRSVGR